ncbi:hypothetical protein ACLB2K_017448 [Fragaria x ananassa]
MPSLLAPLPGSGPRDEAVASQARTDSPHSDSLANQARTDLPGQRPATLNSESPQPSADRLATQRPQRSIATVASQAPTDSPHSDSLANQAQTDSPGQRPATLNSESPQPSVD